MTNDIVQLKQRYVYKYSIIIINKFSRLGNRLLEISTFFPTESHPLYNCSHHCPVNLGQSSAALDTVFL